MKNVAIPVLVAIICLQTGILLGRSITTTARAEEPVLALDAEPFYDPPRLLCRPFQVPLEGAPSAIETNDTTTEIGQWVQREEASYQVFSVDFEIGQKPTGYPQGWAYVCLAPRK